MKIIFSLNSWEEYISWQTHDKKILKRINILIRDILHHPYEGLGKPEPLKYDLAGLWSRRIDRKHRLVYKVINHELLIFSCRYHYDK